MRGDLEVQVKSKVMDEDYPIPAIENIVHKLHGTSDFGNFDISDAYNPTEFDKDGNEIRAIATSQGAFRMCRLPRCLTKPSPIVWNSFGLIP